MAKRVQDPPALDTKTFVARIRDIAAKVALGPFSVFSDEGLPRVHRWLMSTGEYAGDGKGVKDTINAHAVQINEQEADISGLRTKTANHESRLDVLEARPSGGPFLSASG